MKFLMVYFLQVGIGDQDGIFTVLARNFIRRLIPK